MKQTIIKLKIPLSQLDWLCNSKDDLSALNTSSISFIFIVATGCASY